MAKTYLKTHPGNFHRFSFPFLEKSLHSGALSVTGVLAPLEFAASISVGRGSSIQTVEGECCGLAELEEGMQLVAGLWAPGPLSSHLLCSTAGVGGKDPGGNRRPSAGWPRGQAPPPAWDTSWCVRFALPSVYFPGHLPASVQLLRLRPLSPEQTPTPAQRPCSSVRAESSGRAAGGALCTSAPSALAPGLGPLSWAVRARSRAG